MVLSASVVKLNVGGRLFTTTKDTLCKVHDSMLARMFQGDLHSHQDENGAFFIDRDGTHFHSILNYCRDGQCVLPHSDNVQARQELLQEAKFYGLEGLVSALEPHAARLYSSTIERLLSAPHHIRATERLWKAAFREPLLPGHLNGSWVRLTASSNRVTFKGPSCEDSFEAETHPEGFHLALEDAQYLHEVTTSLLPIHFSSLGITCRLSTPITQWLPALTSWTLILDWDKAAWPTSG